MRVALGRAWARFRAGVAVVGRQLGLAEVLALAGYGMLTVGLALVSLALALIVGGLLLLAVAVAGAGRRR